MASSDLVSNIWNTLVRGGGINNAERAAIAEAVLGVEVLRLRLAYVAQWRVLFAPSEALS